MSGEQLGLKQFVYCDASICDSRQYECLGIRMIDGDIRRDFFNSRIDILGADGLSYAHSLLIARSRERGKEKVLGKAFRRNIMRLFRYEHQFCSPAARESGDIALGN